MTDDPPLVDGGIRAEKSLSKNAVPNFPSDMAFDRSWEGLLIVAVSHVSAVRSKIQVDVGAARESIRSSSTWGL
jgi:hypothetical protein